MAGRGQVERGASFDRTNFDDDTVYNLLGPIFVAGADQGDTLEVEVLSLSPGEWAWCGIFPDERLLPEDFPEPYLKTFELAGRSSVKLVPGVEIPLEPFLGTMGTHPDEDGPLSVFPPHKGGGNVDARHIKQGRSYLSLIVRFAVATLPAASVARTVTFAWTFSPLSSASRTSRRCDFFASPSPSPSVPPWKSGRRSTRSDGSSLSFLTFVSFPSARAVHASAPQLTLTRTPHFH
jgi:hypothetical protein